MQSNEYLFEKERSNLFSKSTCDININVLTKMNLGRIKDFNIYVYIACRRVLSPQESNPSTSLLSGQLVRPLRQSPPNM